jgi:hypothetical protein
MRGSHLAVLVGAPLLLCVELLAGPALACSYAIPPPVEPDPSKVGVDVTPPELLEVMVSELVRGIVPSDVRSTCQTHSYISISTHASDDQTPSEKLAYRVEVLRGNLPLRYDEPMAYMFFLWEEDPTEPLDFELRIRAVDEAGNESNSLDLRVMDRVDDTSGSCAFVPARRGRHVAGMSLLLGLGWSLRRRRR